MNTQHLLSDKIPNVVAKISSYKLERLAEVITVLNKRDDLLGILLGGSLTYKDENEKSDIDLFCLFRDTSNHAEIVEEIVNFLNDYDVVIHQGYFPWTQQLYTIYYKSHLDFSIDLCLISLQTVAEFFWEPTGTILIDKQQLILNFRNEQQSNASFPRHPFLKQNPFSLSIITLKKIEKNLSRNHLWNALELLSIFRRYIMQIVRCYIVPEHTFIGRVDRDIEDVLPADLDSQFGRTTAHYSIADIADKAIALVEMLRTFIHLMSQTKEYHLHSWIIGQLDHEQRKLLKYATNAQT